MSFAIKAENLSKVFNINHKVNHYENITEKINNVFSLKWFKNKGSHNSKGAYNETEMFWALKDVNFELEHGDKLAIIGRNGAGKSTILKILSQVMAPTMGKIIINGRLASLLEVGTGFHPELTGRENIYLNGAILGMTRKQIKLSFDDIVDFAEIENFLDTPVKRYSSGMYVRLAFAIAAHLESEILIVDEVLAVGDVLFQKKCLGKMGEVSKEGKTIVFVSHNMKAISSLCNKAIYLSKGTVQGYGEVDEVISQYLVSSSVGNFLHFKESLNKNIPICLIEAKIISDDPSGVISNKSDISIKLKYVINKKVKASHAYLCILTLDDIVVLGSSDCDTNSKGFNEREPGEYECDITFPGGILNEGDYKVNVSFGIPYGEMHQSNYDVLRFKIAMDRDKDEFIHQKRAGIIRIDLPWEYQ